MIEAIGEKHKQFADQLEQRDTEIFVIIPSLLILKSIENDDKDICSFFYPDIKDKTSEKGRILEQLKRNYEAGRKKLGGHEFYNLVEKCLIQVPLNDNENKKSNELDLERSLIKEIRCLAMCLSRFKPADWNKFLDVVIK